MSESSSGKSLLIIGGGILGAVVLILIIVFVISLFKPKHISYEMMEARMVDAAKRYYSKNPSLLPAEDEEVILNYDSLVQEKYIKTLPELLKDGDKCSAHVIVNKTDTDYSYTPYLNCPGSYETVEIYKLLIDSNNIVTSGSGLYKDDNGSYYYRGEVTNNYIKLGQVEKNSKKIDNIWRIVSIESDNTIKIKSLNKLNKSYVWDDRYNENRKTNYGYNTFELSRIKATLNELDINEVIDSTFKSKLVAKNLCIGKRSDNDQDKSGSLECSELSSDKYLFGLLTPYEYMRASLDENCNNTISRSCANYNYLSSSKSTEWTLTASNADDYHVYYYDGRSYATTGAYNNKSIYPTAYLNSKTFFVSGTGTFSDPYIVK